MNNQSSMTAVVVSEHGDLDALKFQERPLAAPKATEVRVAVKACAVNHLDVWVRRGVPGHRFPLPLIPGNDVSGVVDAVGESVVDLEIGDEVIVAPGVSCGTCAPCLSGRDHHCRHYSIVGEHRDGGYASHLVVPRVNVMRKPEGLSFAEAATIGIPFLTAWHMLVSRVGLKPGETVLVQAAGSGVGTAAIQIAKLWGAQVIGTASSSEKLTKATMLGADHVINYRTESVPQRVKEITQRRGADVVFEHVGADSWAGSLASLAWQGRLVTCGATTGADVSIDLRHLFFKSQSILGSTMGSKGELLEVLGHFETKRLRPPPHVVLPLSEVKRAHQMLENREVFGKIILEP